VGLKPGGDGISYGTSLEDSKLLSQYNRHRDDGFEISVFGLADPLKTKREEQKLKRIDAAQALFHAFVNRTEAYDYAHLIGLTLFGSNVSNVCKFTQLFTPFRAHVDEAEAHGDTRLFDALSTAGAIVWFRLRIILMLYFAALPLLLQLGYQTIHVH
jgi:hypothetical protein